MNFSKRFVWRLKLFFALLAVTSMGGLLYPLLFGLPSQFWIISHTFVTGIIGGSLFWGFEILWVPSRQGEFVRHLPFGWAVLVRVVVVAVTVSLTGPLGLLLMNGVFDPFASLRIGFSLYLYVSGVVFLLFSITQIVRIVGPRVVARVVLGRYHRPVREDRVFLFLDIKDSTRLSERLGDIGVQELIARFFFDITEPILEWGGEVHRYIGDEVIVMWTLRHGIENARCLRCCFAIQDRIRARAGGYQKAYGAVPEFRIGLHGGPVVAAQCGDVKQEIAFFGDTINTTARIQQYCKQAGEDLLISDELFDRLPKSDDWSAELIDSVVLRGRQNKIGLLAVSRRDQKTSAGGIHSPCVPHATKSSAPLPDTFSGGQ